MIEAWSALPPEADRKGQQTDAHVRRARHHPALRPGHNKPLGPKEHAEIRPHKEMPDPNVKLFEHKPITPANLRTERYSYLNDIRGERIAKGPVHPKADDINVNDLVGDRMFGDLTFPSNRIHGGLHPISVGDPSRHPATGNDLGIRDDYGGNPVKIHGTIQFTGSMLERVPKTMGTLTQSERGNDRKKINTPKMPIKYEQRPTIDGARSDPTHFNDQPIMPYNSGNQFGYEVSEPRRTPAVPITLLSYEHQLRQNERMKMQVATDRDAAIPVSSYKHRVMSDVASREPNKALQKVPRPKMPHFVPNLDQPERMATDVLKPQNQHVENAPGIDKKFRHPHKLQDSFMNNLFPSTWNHSTLEIGPRAQHGDAIIQRDSFFYEPSTLNTTQHWAPKVPDADPRREEMAINTAELKMSNAIVNNALHTQLPTMVESRF